MLPRLLIAIEVLVLIALIALTRCANFQEVFVDGNVYFTDADCYARMTRVRICADHPGTIVRHHEFENFPQGTTPHTTAPLDYLILGLATLLKPFTARSVDLAGAFISPVFAVIGGWFLWWWSRQMKFRYRWILLILYAVSPILVHGTVLGRPDHQSLLMLLITVGVCAEWTLHTEPSRQWAIVSALAWGVALWVSFYEPLVLLVLVVIASLTKNRHSAFGGHRRAGWIVFGTMIALAFLIERRIPFSWAIFGSGAFFTNWSRTIGELAHVLPNSRLWFVWAGYMIVIAPILIWLSTSVTERRTPVFVFLLLVATYGLTIWQARWGYFFVLLFALVLPSLLEAIKSRPAVWIAFALSILPLLQFWDERIWSNQSELAARIERRNESHDLRELAISIRSGHQAAFLAPWWLSPAIAYWSGQPGVAGSSHEALKGTADVARFFLSDNPATAREILRQRQVEWVIAYDWDRVGPNSANLLGMRVPDSSMGRILDRTPASAPAYLVLSGQSRAVKLFRFANKL